MPHTRVLIADSHPIIGQGLTALLEGVPDIEVLATARTVEMAESMVDELNPDVLVLDADLGATNCAHLANSLRQREVPISTILLSSGDGPDQPEDAEEFGVTDYVLRGASLDDVVSAIRFAHSGDLWISPSTFSTLLNAMQAKGLIGTEAPLRPLTQRESEILELLVGGLGHKAIAEKLRLSVNTIRTHTRNIQMKLNVHSNVEAVSVALERGVRPN